MWLLVSGKIGVVNSQCWNETTKLSQNCRLPAKCICARQPVTGTGREDKVPDARHGGCLCLSGEVHSHLLEEIVH